MILYFVRHGQTDFNTTNRLQGAAFDESLNETGVKEMNALLPMLPKDFEIIYSSPLKRVFASAEIISEYSHKRIIVSENISERDFGSLAGKKWDDIPNGQTLQSIDRKQKYNYHPFGGESVQDVEKRVNRFCDEITSSGYAVAIVVSSIGIIRLVYKLFRGEEEIEVRNASVHKFTL
jgi:broad specificity phosphatase PhoE